MFRVSFWGDSDFTPKNYLNPENIFESLEFEEEN